MGCCLHVGLRLGQTCFLSMALSEDCNITHSTWMVSSTGTVRTTYFSIRGASYSPPTSV